MTGDRDPEKSFIHKYVEYTRNQESPLSFHIWTALTVLASVMGRKCFMNRGFYVLYPNLFTILVAGSALCRKSTSIALATNLVDLDTIPGALVFKGKVTPEKLTKDIAEAQLIEPSTGEWATPNVLICASELSVFLTKQSYGEPTIHVLTDLFDCPKKWEFKTKNRGTDTLHNVFICILAATTPDGVAKGIPESALQEGFASRIMFVYEPSTDRSNAFPEKTKEDMILEKRCQQMLVDRAKMSGEFKLTPDAKAWFGDWYDNVYKKGNPRDRRLQGFYGRKHDHLLRLGMIFAASNGETEILVGDLEASLLALEQVERSAPGAFAEIGSTPASNHYLRLETYMRSYKEINHSLLLKLMYPCAAKEFHELLETAFQVGMIVRDPERKSMYIYTGDYKKDKAS